MKPLQTILESAPYSPSGRKLKIALFDTEGNPISPGDGQPGPAGADGAPGEPGPKGDQGDPGPAGADSPVGVGLPIYDEPLVNQSAPIVIGGLDGDADESYRIVIEGRYHAADLSANPRYIFVRPNNLAAGAVPGTNMLHGVFDDGGGTAFAGHSAGRVGGGNGLMLSELNWTLDEQDGEFLAYGDLVAHRGNNRRRHWLAHFISSPDFDDSKMVNGHIGGYWYDATTPLVSLAIDFGGVAFTGRVSVFKRLGGGSGSSGGSALTSAETYRDLILATPNLAGYWPLQGDGNDASPAGANLAPTGAGVTWGGGDGPFGDASAHFDGTAVLSRAVSVMQGLNGELTLEGWFYVPSRADVRGLIAKLGDTNAPGKGFGFGYGTIDDTNPGRYAKALYETKTWLTWSTPPKFVGPGWHYLAVAFGNNYYTLQCLDGKFIDGPAGSLSGNPVAIAGPMSIGGDVQAASRNINGVRLAHVAAYARYLSEAEMLAHASVMTRLT